MARPDKRRSKSSNSRASKKPGDASITDGLPQSNPDPKQAHKEASKQKKTISKYNFLTVQKTKKSFFQVLKVKIQTIKPYLTKEKFAGAVIFLVISLIPTLWLYFNDMIPQLRTVNRMTGEWNVAVAYFTNSGTDLRRPDVVTISSIFANRFNQEMSELGETTNIVVQVRNPQELDRSVGGKTDKERANNAKKIADDMNIDLLIYGTLSKTDLGYALQPEFYIRSDNYYEAEELVGEHTLGSPINVTARRDTLSSQIQLNVELSRRSEIMALVARGLSLYLAQSYNQAYEAFSMANRDEYWSIPNGREAIFLFLGNAAIRMNQLDVAESAYKQSIELERQYARGYVGLGNVTYLKALAPTNTDNFKPDKNELIKARSYYDQALQAKKQPEGAEVPDRVAFGLGQIYLTEWFIGLDTKEQAIQQFNLIVNHYSSKSKPALKELASEAHSRLGIIYRQEGDLDKATTEFHSALELSNNPSRKGLLLATLSDLLREQGSDEEADIASLEAIQQYQIALEITFSPKVKASYWRNIAEQYVAIDKNDEAIRAYVEAVDLLPVDSSERQEIQQAVSELEAQMEDSP